MNTPPLIPLRAAEWEADKWGPLSGLNRGEGGNREGGAFAGDTPTRSPQWLLKLVGMDSGQYGEQIRT